MRFRLFSLLVVLLMLVVAVGLVAAQDDGDADGSGYAALYEGIPQFRGEDGAFTLGDPDAPVTVIEFADYLCGFCQTYHDATIKPFIEQYVATGQAKFEYRFMPIIDANFSTFMAATTECAADQGAFWATYELMYELAFNRTLTADLPLTVAERLNLDGEELAACVNELGMRPFQFETDYDLGVELGVTGTPAIRVRVGDGPEGAIRIDGTVYERGGPALPILATFVESDTPEELVRLVNRLLDDQMLPDDSLLTGEPCAAPCWNEITVGETPWADAVAILEDDDRLSAIQIQTAQGSPAQRALWGVPGADPCCQMVTFDGETIAYMQLLFSPLMTLGELLDVHDAPDYLIGSETTRDQAVFTLIYAEMPMLVYVFVAGAAAGELSETSEILGVQYLLPEDMDDLVLSNVLYVWDGFKSYQDYMSGEPDVIGGVAP